MFNFAAVIASGLALSVNGKQNVRSNDAKIASLQQQIDASLQQQTDHSMLNQRQGIKITLFAKR